MDSESPTLRRAATRGKERFTSTCAAFSPGGHAPTHSDDGQPGPTGHRPRACGGGDRGSGRPGGTCHLDRLAGVRLIVLDLAQVAFHDRSHRVGQGHTVRQGRSPARRRKNAPELGVSPGIDEREADHGAVGGDIQHGAQDIRLDARGRLVPPEKVRGEPGLKGLGHLTGGRASVRWPHGWGDQDREHRENSQQAQARDRLVDSQR
jgi:hypothetical protein